MYILQVILAALFCIALFILALSMFTLRVTLDRRVRRAMPVDKVYDNYPDWYFGIGRAIMFGAASVFEFPKKSTAMAIFYDSFDVKSFANRYEKAIAWAMIISHVSMFVIGAIQYSLEFLGWLPPMLTQ